MRRIGSAANAMLRTTGSVPRAARRSDSPQRSPLAHRVRRGAAQVHGHRSRASSTVSTGGSPSLVSVAAKALRAPLARSVVIASRWLRVTVRDGPCCLVLGSSACGAHPERDRAGSSRSLPMTSRAGRTPAAASGRDCARGRAIPWALHGRRPWPRHTPGVPLLQVPLMSIRRDRGKRADESLSRDSPIRCRESAISVLPRVAPSRLCRPLAGETAPIGRVGWGGNAAAHHCG